MSARRVLQEKPQGEFATLWKTSLEEDTGLEQVELNAALADFMAAKGATEQVTATALLVRVSPSPHPGPNPNPDPNPPCAHAVRASAGTHTRPENPARHFSTFLLTLTLTLTPFPPIYSYMPQICQR